MEAEGTRRVRSSRFFCPSLTKIFYSQVYMYMGDRGSTVVKVLRYKSEGLWFDPSWRHWNFSLT